MRRIRGLTLVELLVVIAIILLLAGIVMAASRRAVDSARMTQARSDIRQIGMAVLMYREELGGYPLHRLDPVVQAGFLTETSILKVPSDPYPKGYARHVYDCTFDSWGEQNRTKLVTSYEDVFIWNETNRNNLWLDEMIRPIDPDPALVALRVFGQHDGRSVDSCVGATTAFLGRTLRFHEDGSARTFHFWDGDPVLRDRFCWPALFSNEPPDVVCRITRQPQE